MGAKRFDHTTDGLQLPQRPLNLRVWDDSDDDPEPPPIEAISRDQPEKYRTIGPVPTQERLEHWPLRTCLGRLKTAWPGSRKESSWKQYDALLRRWEEHFVGSGPDVRDISPDDLQAFFTATTSWASARTWEKNLDMLMAILKSACKQTHTNKMGVPKGVEAPLKIDDLPFVSIPSQDWFRENREFGSGRSGGHMPKRRADLTLEQYQLVIDACWRIGLPDPVWWETLFAWLWFSGMRITQARRNLCWSEDPDSDGIHIESMTIVTNESKKGGLIDVPLPRCLEAGFKTLWYRHKPDKYRAFVFRQHGTSGQTAFYEQWNAIWQAAIPCRDEQEKSLRHFNPHQVRAVSVTNWDLRPAPDNHAGFLITGHQPGDTRQAAYFKPGDSRLREIVDRFPMPRLRCPRPLF